MAATSPPRKKPSANVALAARQFAGLVLIFALLLVGGCGGSSRSHNSASRAGSYASYNALHRPGPNGILVVQPSQASAASKLSARPIWVAVRPQYHGAIIPDVRAARELTPSGDDRIWIAPSNRAGICLLDFSPQMATDVAHAHAVLASCSAHSELTQGTAVVLGRTGSHGEKMILGLVPDPVRAVAVKFARGAAAAVPVHNNLYVLVTSRQVRAVTFQGADDKSITQIQLGGVQ
jgi:hypothetical protein